MLIRDAVTGLKHIEVDGFKSHTPARRAGWKVRDARLTGGARTGWEKFALFGSRKVVGYEVVLDGTFYHLFHHRRGNRSKFNGTIVRQTLRSLFLWQRIITGGFWAVGNTPKFVKTVKRLDFIRGTSRPRLTTADGWTLSGPWRISGLKLAALGNSINAKRHSG